MRIARDVNGIEDAVERLFRDAFTASEGADEGDLVGGLARDLLRTTPPEDIRVFTAVEGDAPIGAGIFSRLTFSEDTRIVMLLSPMAVATDRQKTGVGQALLTHALDALRDEGVDVAMTYGDPAYYGQVGFQPVTEAQVSAPLPLSFPHGWIGQSLTGGGLPDLKGSSTCVPALNRPDIW